MFSMTRRAFLGATVAGLSSGSAFATGPGPQEAGKRDPGRPATLFLTWRRDPTTTMVVQWVGPKDEVADPTVYYAPVPARDQPWTSSAARPSPYPLTDFSLFQTELTGLTPGTDYEFRVGKQGTVCRFCTMPAKATDTIHFISGGDCGVNAHTVANNIQAARQEPMFSVIGGDLAYDNGTAAATNLAFLRNYSQHMVGAQSRLIPMVACIGNHEVAGQYGKTRLKAPFFYALFGGLYPDTGYATLDFGDYLSLVLLDTGHTSAIAGDQTDWLEKTLKDRADHPNVFVVGHVPAYPSSRAMTSKNKAGSGTENRRHWVPLFDKYRVPVVLEHHDHTFKRSKLLLDGLPHSNGVLYLGDGSWGQLTAPQPPDQVPLLEKVSQRYHLSLHRIQGEQRFHLALDEFGRVMDTAHSGQRKKGAVTAGG